MSTSDEFSRSPESSSVQSRVIQEAFGNWEADRVSILKNMLRKGFNHYTNIMTTLVENINSVLDMDHVETERQRARIKAGKLTKLTSPGFDQANIALRKLFVNQEGPWWKQDFPKLTRNRNPAAALVAVLANKKLIDYGFEQQSWMTPYQQLLISTCISTYFEETPAMYPVHQNMFYALQSSSGSLLSRETPKTYISGAGPFLIKTLQQVSNGLGSSSNMRKITESVFSSILPMTPGELEVIRDKLSVIEKYKNFADRSLGSASIGETHECLDEYDRPIAVLKFIKPVSAWLFLCEVDFLLTTVWPRLAENAKKAKNANENNEMNVKKCRQLLLFLIREFANEFNVEREAEGTKDARQIYYRPKIGILTPALYEYHAGPIPVLVLQFIKGISLDEFMNTVEKRLAIAKTLKDYQEQKKIIKCLVPIQRRVAMLMGLWLKELFWGSGRFDADPHKGNVIVPTCQDLDNGVKPFIALIDFGSHGKLDRRSQCIVFQTLISGERIVQFKDCLPEKLTPVDQVPPMKPEKIAQLKALQPLLNHFTEYDKLSRVDQLEVFACVDRRIHANPRVHDLNVEHVRSVIQNIWKICNVKEDTRETDKLIPVCMDYGKLIDFGTIFLTVAQHATSIGTCSSSNVLMYGRGLAYLDQMWRSTGKACADLETDVVTQARSERDLARYLGVGMEKCDRGKLINLIWKNFFTHPGLGARFLTNCWFA